MQVLGEVGAISKCFDRGHEMSPTNMIKWLKIQRKEVISSEVLQSNGVSKIGASVSLCLLIAFNFLF